MSHTVAHDLLLRALSYGDPAHFETELGKLVRVTATLMEAGAFLESEDKPYGQAISLLLSRVNQTGLDETGAISRFAGTSLLTIQNHLKSLLTEKYSGMRPWLCTKVSEQTRHVPSTSKPEMVQYYKWISGQCCGEGHIVEIGAWLGSSTRALCEGQHGSISKCQLHVYDAFIWEGWMDRFLRQLPMCQLPRPGDSFLELFNFYLGEYQDQVAVHLGYLESGADCAIKPLVWNIDGPVELVVYDMGPNLAILNMIWQQISPYFIKSRTVIVFNEYGQISSSAIWEFCRNRTNCLVPHHKPHTAAKAFLYV